MSSRVYLFYWSTFWGQAQTVTANTLKDVVKTGDVLVFRSNRGSELGHVALVLDNFERLWVASHWSLPREKMIKITPNRIFSAARDSAFENFNLETQCMSETLKQAQADMSKLLAMDAITPGSLAMLKQDRVRDRTYLEVSTLIGSAKEKRALEYNRFSEFKIQPYEQNSINTLYGQATEVMHSFESVMEKYKENKEVLGLVYDLVDDVDQMSTFYEGLYYLEYLASDTVTVSTKFRPFFEAS